MTWPDAPAPVIEALRASSGGVVALRRSGGAAGLDRVSGGGVAVGVPEGVAWGRALAAVAAEGAWLATWAEPGDGPLRVHHLSGAPPTGHPVVIPGCATGDCWASARALSVDGDGVWVGGGWGVHSNEVALVGFVARVDHEGRTTSGWSFDAGDPAFETSVDALAVVPAGVAVVGHRTLDASGGDRLRLWFALIGGDGAARGPFDLGVDDATWSSPAAPPAASASGGAWVVAGVDPGARVARVLRVTDDGVVASSAEVRLADGDGVGVVAARLLVGEVDGAVIVARSVSATPTLPGEVTVSRLDPTTLAVVSRVTRALPIGADVRAITLDGDRLVLGGQTPGGAFVVTVPE